MSSVALQGLDWNQGSVGDEFLPVHEAFGCLFQQPAQLFNGNQILLKLFNLGAMPKILFCTCIFKGSVFSYCFSLSTNSRSSSAELSSS